MAYVCQTQADAMDSMTVEMEVMRMAVVRIVKADGMGGLRTIALASQVH